ncbi:hypothetical protein CRE_16638 [Caenorhabditis remanei]|uniref:Uncharacterized protein n=1 Tax=Caenorhabditis remanei TaxID=31234 RepID=E3MAV8_CAERE|nr:hypothetical protein CRE_16638 [Caenorhabditis remanei]
MPISYFQSDESRMSFEHRSVVRLFSNSSTTSNGSRKTSVPSAVLASAPLMSAAIGDGLGTQLFEVTGEDPTFAISYSVRDLIVGPFEHVLMKKSVRRGV